MKINHNNYKILFVVLFLLMLALPTINSVFGIVEFERKDENRTFNDSLSFDISLLDQFPTDFDAYYNDNFSFRTALLDLFHSLKFHVFKTSPNPEKTVIGSNGWFFMAGKEIELFTGKDYLTDEDLYEFMVEWDRRINYLDSLGIKCYWMIGPCKHYVYSKELPFYIRRSEIRRTDVLNEYISRRYPDLIIDPLEDLIKISKEKKVYYQLDNHWNDYAGYCVSKMFVDRVKKDFPDRKVGELPEYVWTEQKISKGYHYNVIGVDDLSEKVLVSDKSINKAYQTEEYGFEPPPEFAYTHLYEQRWLNDKENDKDMKILIIRDSFGGFFRPYLPEAFKETVIIFDKWRYLLDKEIIETLKPDIILYIGLETHIRNVTKFS